MKVKFVCMFVVSFLFVCHISHAGVKARCLVKYALNSDTTKKIVDTLEVDFFSGAEINSICKKMEGYIAEPVKNIFGFIWFDKAVNKYAVAVLNDIELKDDESYQINTEYVKSHLVVYGYDKEMTWYGIRVLSVIGDNTK